MKLHEFLFTFHAISLLSGCGALKNLDTMKEKMESMNQKLGDMTANVGKMQSGMEKMTNGMEGMGAGLHMQTLALGIKEILSDDAQKYTTLTSFNPLPMVPSGKLIADAADPLELLQLFYLWVQEINTATLDGETTEQTRNEIDLFKVRKLNAMQVIAGMVEDAKVEEIIKFSGGRFHVGAGAFLILRHLFIRVYVLENGLSNIEKPNTEEQSAIDAAKLSLKQIEDLLDSDKMELKLTGFYTAELNQTVKIEVSK